MAKAIFDWFPEENFNSFLIFLGFIPAFPGFFSVLFFIFVKESMINDLCLGHTGWLTKAGKDKVDNHVADFSKRLLKKCDKVEIKTDVLVQNGFH